MSSSPQPPPLPLLPPGAVLQKMGEPLEYFAGVFQVPSGWEEEGGGGGGGGGGGSIRVSGVSLESGGGGGAGGGARAVRQGRKKFLWWLLLLPHLPPPPPPFPPPLSIIPHIRKHMEQNKPPCTYIGSKKKSTHFPVFCKRHPFSRKLRFTLACLEPT